MVFIKKLEITPKILRLIAEIDEFKGHWRALEKIAPDRLAALRKIATIESIGSSTRIEGAKLTDEEIEKLLAGLQVFSFRSRDEQEVAGYAELMEMIFASWEEIPLTENHIKQLHGVLLKYSHKDERHRGNYKILPNHVEAFDESGRSMGVIFQTASPFDTPRLMESLAHWYAETLAAGGYHPLLVIAVFAVRFLAIHPFQDGNGRLCRALTTLLLLRAGYVHIPYSSLERVIENDKERYYLSLRAAQSTLDKDESQLGIWVEFFLECLTAQKNALLQKIERERLLASLPPLSGQLVALAREHGRINVSNAVKITKANRNTIKAHLRNLTATKKLKKMGAGRGTWYEPL